MSSRVLVWAVIIALAVLDVLILLNIAALWVSDHPARPAATLPFALGHAFWRARLCSDFELNDRVTWREFFVGLPMLPLAAAPYGWLAIGGNAATPSADYGFGGIAAVIVIVMFGLACAFAGASLPASSALFFISCVRLSLGRISWRTFESLQPSLAVGPSPLASHSWAIRLPRTRCFRSRASAGC